VYVAFALSAMVIASSIFGAIPYFSLKALIPNFVEINRKLDRFDVLEYRHISGDFDIIPHDNIDRQTQHYG